MKIGIITLAKGENYGGSLQNYAVMKVYENLGHEALTIFDSTRQGIRVEKEKESTLAKLRPSYIKAVFKVRTGTKYHIKNQRDRLIPSIIRAKKNASVIAEAKRGRTASFSHFWDNYIKHTDFSIDIKAVPKKEIEDFDFFSVGSDQVWNPTYPSTSGIKFLNFVPKSKKLTFSPSFGLGELPEYVKESYSKWLQDFNLISVREERGAELIRSLCQKDAEVICDPTIALPLEYWKAIEAKPEFETDKPYILTYFLGNETNSYRRYIEKIAKEKDCRIINLLELREPQHYTAGPREFLYLVHHAEAVFTDSFHAAVFSILYKRDFVVFDRVEWGSSMGSRLKTLLSVFSLEHRTYENMKVTAFSPVDFSHPETVIECEQKKAVDFIKRSIETNLQS